MTDKLDIIPRALPESGEGTLREREFVRISDVINSAQERSSFIVSSYNRIHDSYKLISHQRAIERNLIDLELAESISAEEEAVFREKFIRERLGGYPEGVRRVLSIFKSLDLEQLAQATQESKQKVGTSKARRWEYDKEDSKISEEFTIESTRILYSQLEGVLNDYQLFYEHISQLIDAKYMEEFKDFHIREFPYLDKNSSSGHFYFGIRVLIGTLALSKIEEIKEISRSNGIPEEVIHAAQEKINEKRKYDLDYQQRHIGGAGVSSEIDDIYAYENVRVAFNFLQGKEELKMLFGEYFENIQQSIYTSSLESSLFQSYEAKDPYRLREFFTSESLRVLLINAASSQRYPDSSGKVLGSLEAIKIYMQNPEWPTLLKDTLKKYPELESFRAVLENGNPESLSFENIELTSAYIESILNIYRERNGNSDNLNYRNLLDSVPSSYFLNELVRTGRIDEKLSIEIEKLFEVLKDDRKADFLDSYTSKIRTYLINEIYNSYENSDYELNKELLSNLGFLKDFLDRKYNQYSDEGITERVLDKNSFYNPRGLEFLNLLKVLDSVEVNLKESGGQIDQENWNNYLITYIAVQNRSSYRFLDNETVLKANSIFADKESANLCLQQMLVQWRKYLGQEDTTSLPDVLRQVSSIINLYTEIGPYSQLKTLGIFLSKYNSFIKNENISENTKSNIYELFKIFDTKLLDSKKISNETRINFYSLVGDLVSSSPDLLEKMLPFILKLQNDNKELLKFSELVLPKIHVLNLIFKGTSLQNLDTALLESQNVDQLLRNLEVIVQNSFETNLGIKKVPENLDNEVLGKLNNILTYLSYIKDRDSAKEAVLTFYASQILNNNWSNFRSGEALDVKEYVNERSASFMDDILAKRREFSRRIFEGLPLSEDQIKELIQLLQDETQNIAVTNIETIDLKLQNIVSSVESFIDLDLFPEGLDKSRLLLLKKFDPKLVGACVSKLYRLSSSETDVSKLSFTEFKEEERLVLESIKVIFDEFKIEFTQENIKLYFQDGMKLLSNIVSLEKFVNESDISGKVHDMRRSLIPDGELVSIFQRVGEGFTPVSGAYALSSDLKYLKGLIQRHADDFSDSEKEKINKYLNGISEGMKNLEEIHKKIIERLVKITESPNYENNIELKNLVDESIKMANRNSSSNEISTLLTNDLNVIIENIRACLSCRSAECNNDTNLSFGDFNKFFLCTSIEGKGISDQIVYFLPVTRLDGKKELSFVIDTAYGDSGVSIMVNHLETVMKKVRQLKSKFTDLEISIVLPAKYDFSGNVVTSMTNKGYQIERESVKTNLVPSAFSLHYPEFGPVGRVIGGEFDFSCFIIKG